MGVDVRLHALDGGVIGETFNTMAGEGGLQEWVFGSGGGTSGRFFIGVWKMRLEYRADFR